VRGPRFQSHHGRLCLSWHTRRYSHGHWLSTFTAMPWLTQPSTLCRTVKWVTGNDNKRLSSCGWQISSTVQILWAARIVSYLYTKFGTALSTKWKWYPHKRRHTICILFILCFTWTVNANSLKTKQLYKYVLRHLGRMNRSTFCLQKGGS